MSAFIQKREIHTSARSTISLRPPANDLTSLSIRIFQSEWNFSRLAASGSEDGPAVALSVSNAEDVGGGGLLRPRVDEGRATD